MEQPYLMNAFRKLGFQQEKKPQGKYFLTASFRRMSGAQTKAGMLPAAFTDMC